MGRRPLDNFNDKELVAVFENVAKDRRFQPRLPNNKREFIGEDQSFWSVPQLGSAKDKPKLYQHMKDAATAARCEWERICEEDFFEVKDPDW